MSAVVLSANRTSSAMPLKNIVLYSIQATITGTPTGTVKLQASADPETNDTMPDGSPKPSPTHWTDITDSTFTVLAAGNVMWNVREIGYNYVRVVYTDASSGASTAVMTAVLNAKGV